MAANYLKCKFLPSLQWSWASNFNPKVTERCSLTKNKHKKNTINMQCLKRGRNSCQLQFVMSMNFIDRFGPCSFPVRVSDLWVKLCEPCHKNWKRKIVIDRHLQRLLYGQPKLSNSATGQNESEWDADTQTRICGAQKSTKSDLCHKKVGQKKWITFCFNLHAKRLQ